VAIYICGVTSVRIDPTRVWLNEADCDLADFVAIVGTATDPADYPNATEVVDNVVVYDGDHLRDVFVDPSARRVVQAEFARAFLDGPGIIACRRAFADISVVDAATQAFAAMIARQRAAGTLSGDHYAKPGDNDRVWNALEKLAVEAPDVFVAYYANDIIAAASAAWLGPGYALTSQINQVNPGGPAQSPHRDYHLGFTTIETALQYPSHTHLLSAALTLQGAIAHCDMPVETGPTMYLPHSQKYLLGYVAWRRPEFRDYFAEHRVQLPLTKGDAVFFNPAVFHAAGGNRTDDVHRIANLLQINSGLGKALEAIDHQRVCNAVFPSLQAMKAAGTTPSELDNAIVAAADCYPFPTNLDRDQPIGGLTPPSQADIVRRALVDNWTADALAAELIAYAGRRVTHGDPSA
jgi:ectoine hydroxylase-related dioxygenase (phytanoyl-CoA dioxygenase family)